MTDFTYPWALKIILSKYPQYWGPLGVASVFKVIFRFGAFFHLGVFNWINDCFGQNFFKYDVCTLLLANILVDVQRMSQTRCHFHCNTSSVYWSRVRYKEEVIFEHICVRKVYLLYLSAALIKKGSEHFSADD